MSDVWGRLSKKLEVKDELGFFRSVGDMFVRFACLLVEEDQFDVLSVFQVCVHVGVDSCRLRI